MLSDVVDSRRQSSVNSALCRAGFVYDAGSSQIQLRPETERPFRAGPKEVKKKTNYTSRLSPACFGQKRRVDFSEKKNETKRENGGMGISTCIFFQFDQINITCSLVLLLVFYFVFIFPLFSRSPSLGPTLP